MLESIPTDEMNTEMINEKPSSQVVSCTVQRPSATANKRISWIWQIHSKLRLISNTEWFVTYLRISFENDLDIFTFFVAVVDEFNCCCSWVDHFDHLNGPVRFKIIQ